MHSWMKQDKGQMQGETQIYAITKYEFNLYLNIYNYH